MPKRTEKLIVGDRRATSIGMGPAASIDISCLLHLALKRRRCKLAVQTVYTHQQIKDFVKAKIGPEWHIFVPTFPKTSINHSLSAAWPADESATAKAKLWPGSSMEFVSMPLKVSRFDLDQRANTRKRKRRTEEGDTKQRQKQNSKKQQRGPRMECGRRNKDNVDIINKQSMEWEEYMVQQRKTFGIEAGSEAGRPHK